VVASRAEKLDSAAEIEAQVLQLEALFNRIDARVADVIEHGVSERLYFLRVKLPRVDGHAEGIVQPVRTRYLPINSPTQSDLVPLVRSQLRPPPGRPRPPQSAARSRLDFQAAINHRPGDPGPSLSV
ncbi:MAG: hypothetical protein ACRDVZ_14255, partial [Jiangellaceae bacterium]